jgi:hypothetical protein
MTTRSTKSKREIFSTGREENDWEETLIESPPGMEETDAGLLDDGLCWFFAAG